MYSQRTIVISKLFLSLILIAFFGAYSENVNSGNITEGEKEVYIPELSKDLIEKRVFTLEEMKSRLNWKEARDQPLFRLIAFPELFYDKLIFTGGFFIMDSPNTGRLFLSKADAEVFNVYNSIRILGPSDKIDDSPLKPFHNQYVIVGGTFSSLAHELVMYELLDLKDLENFFEMFNNYKSDPN